MTHVWQCTREITRGETKTIETAVGIASLPPSLATAEKLNQYLRGHWGIETRLHKQRDSVFGEDSGMIRKGHAPQTMAILRNIVTSMFHRGTVRNFRSAMRKFAADPEAAAASRSLVSNLRRRPARQRSLS